MAGHRLPLGAYLLKPVQRITKYQLILKVWWYLWLCYFFKQGSFPHGPNCLLSGLDHVQLDLKIRHHGHGIGLWDVDHVFFSKYILSVLITGTGQAFCWKGVQTWDRSGGGLRFGITATIECQHAPKPYLRLSSKFKFDFWLERCHSIRWGPFLSDA